MRFSIIYSFDCGMEDSVQAYTPPNRHLWDLTEREDGEPSDWCSELFGGKCKHRKWVAVLNKKQFEDFLDHTGLFPEEVETMGSLGAPGCGWLAPAISFRNDDPDAIQSAYVTPLIDVEVKGEMTERKGDRAWKRVRQAILNKYGY